MSQSSFDKYLFLTELYNNSSCSLEKLKQLGFNKENDLSYILKIGCYPESGSIKIDNSQIYF
jgi:hypothetical protein